MSLAACLLFVVRWSSLPLLGYGAIAGRYEVVVAAVVLVGVGFALDDADGETPRRATQPRARPGADLTGDAALARLRDLYAYDAITPLQLDEATGFVLAGGTITTAGAPRSIPVKTRKLNWDERRLPPMW